MIDIVNFLPFHGAMEIYILVNHTIIQRNAIGFSILRDS